MAVVDTNIIVHGRGSIDFDRIFFTPEVLEEVKSRHGKNIVRNLDYTVSKPGEDSVRKIEEKAEELNSPTSDVDEALLALAMDLDEVIVTDDKALQNLALHMDVSVKGFHDPVLEEKFKWVMKCSNCGEKVSSPPCPRCGSPQTVRKQVHCS
jgi:UPF0271 protein